MSAFNALRGCGKGDAQIVPHQVFVSINVKLAVILFLRVSLPWQPSWIRLNSKADLS